VAGRHLTGQGVALITKCHDKEPLLSHPGLIGSVGQAPRMTRSQYQNRSLSNRVIRCQSLGSRATAVKVREVTRDLEARGWRAQCQRGRHRVYRHSDHPDRRAVIAGNDGTIMPTTTPGSDLSSSRDQTLLIGDDEALVRYSVIYEQGIQAGARRFPTFWCCVAVGPTEPRSRRSSSKRLAPSRTTRATQGSATFRLGVPPGWSTSPDENLARARQRSSQRCSLSAPRWHGYRWQMVRNATGLR